MNAPFIPASDVASSPQRKHSPFLQLAGILGLAVIARIIFWNVRPPDMAIFLDPWFAHIVHYGPVGAFAHPFSNYEPAYLYLLAFGSFAAGVLTPMTIIKTLSVAGTLFMTAALAELLKATGAHRRGALTLLVLPSVLFNDALLAQCDALWAGACILALAGMIRGRTLSSMVWCGVAIAFKAQAAFLAPVMIGAMVGRRAPWWQWTVPVLVFLATLVPAALMGWPWSRLLTVYLDQAAWDHIPGRLANPWMLGTLFADHASRNWFAFGYFGATAAGLTIAALASRSARNPRVLLLLAALAGTALPFLLPKMLERYYFLGDGLTLALALTLRNRPAVLAMCGVQAASILSFISLMCCYHQPYPSLVGALFAAAGLATLWLLAMPQLKSLIIDLRSRIGRRPAPAISTAIPG